MLCPECNKREATIHLTQIVNNQKVTVSLCKCAVSSGGNSVRYDAESVADNEKSGGRIAGV